MSKADNKTWRETRVTLPPNEQTTVYFRDTKPNHLLISNSGAAAIYVAVNASVSAQTYDMIIPPRATKLYPRMHGTDRFNLYSDNPDTIDIAVTSWEGEFDPSSVAQSVEMVGGGADGLLGIVEINNILTSLPSGDNVIGGVVVADYAKPLPTGNNKIGSVEVLNAQPIPAGVNKIGVVEVDNLEHDGATSFQVTASGAGIVTVKASAGVVYAVVGDCDLMDGTRKAWAGQFNNAKGLKCTSTIALDFKAAGEAFILYK